MKGKLFKKALAVATSVLMLSGGVPIQPLSQVFEDIAITASAEGTTVDLSTLADNYTAKDGDVLTGSTTGTVTIAGNANITLNSATISGGIVCEGSATITLAGTNSVTAGYGKAGIQVGGSGTTLTIKGDGSLTANGGYNSAGIGLSALMNYDSNVSSGNIVIEGGTITAIGGDQGAGIGTGIIKNTKNDNSTSVQFGNITIKGGTVTATGGSSGDGVGKGYSYPGPSITFGIVTIYDGINMVNASSIKNSESIVYMHDEENVTATASNYFTITEDGNRRIIAPKDDTDYTITIANGIEHGSLTGAATAKYMEKVTITATPDLGYRLIILVVKDAQNNDVATTGNAFLMPKGNVTVSAVFEQGVHGTTEFRLRYFTGTGDEQYESFYDGVTTVELQRGQSYRIFKYDNASRYRKFLLDNSTSEATIPYSGGTGTFLENGNGTNFRVDYNGESGLYDITMTDVSNGKWSVSILKTVGVIDNIPDQEYTGSEIKPEPLVTAGSLSLTKGTDYEYSYSDNTNAGTAKVTVTFKGNYASLGSVEKEFKIKATPTVTAPTPKNPTHYSSPVELINAGTAQDGTMYYSLGTASAPGGDWTANASEITANSAGTFYVWYRINDDVTTQDMITVTVSQGKLSQSWSILIDSYEYDGTAHEPTIDGTAYGTLTYSYYNIDTDEVTTQAPSAVGNYRVTATASGNENYIAAVRQASYSITEAKAAEPIVVRARNAYFTGLMDLVVKFKLPESVTADSKAYVEYSWTEGTEKRTEKKLVSELTTGTVGDDKVYVVENPVYAPEMENKVTYKFFDGNGKQLNMTNADGTEMYKDGYQFSLRDYLDLAMANGNDDMKALADAAYDYGVASQINFKYGDYENLKVSDKVKAVKLSDLEKYKLTESGTLPEIIKNVKYSVEFAMDNTLRVKFNFKKAPTDAELKSLTCTIDGKAAELVKLSDTQYALVVKNIAAPQIDTAHTFTITDGKNTYTTVRSALSYAYSAIEANTNPTLVDLAKAMYLYNQAANEKFAE